MKRKQFVCLCLLFFGFASVAQAQVERVSLRVDGLACPFCAYGLEKKINKLEGIGEIIINVDQGIANITKEEGQSIQFDKLAQAVRDAGFTPKEMSITAVGKISKKNGEAVLLVNGNDAEFIIKSDGQEQLQETRAVKVTGRVTLAESEESKLYFLAVEEIESI